MINPFIPAALAPVALAGLLALVPGTSQAASTAAGSPTATAPRAVVPAATVALSSPTRQAQKGDNHARASRSQTRPAVANGAKHQLHSHGGAAASSPEKQVKHSTP